ncbi:MAG: DUF4886 domain-containing protein [Oscillospiraceae bacterium]|nr:DUF4886 domain-containing protein [Oscillospiraceae bacterium]
MKKFLAIMVALIVMVTVSAFIVNAENQTIYCERCNQDVSNDDWQNWDFTSGTVSGGHYRLTDDFLGQTDVVKIPEDTIVCLDLCGYTYSTKNIVTFNISGTFTVMDSKGGGTFMVSGKNSTHGSFAVVQSSGTFKLYGGAIRHASLPNVSQYSAGLIYIDGGRVDIHDGTISGGKVMATTKVNSQGGNITLHNGGRLYVHGGKIENGIALKSSEKTAQGGNIYASGGSKVNISGGIIENGYSDAGGGNIFIADATLEISGGTIRNGHALVSGGNIMANATSANTVIISGGTITGGVAGGTYTSYSNNTFARGSKGGGNIYERTPTGILTISGGVIDGDIVLDYAENVTLSGTPKIGLGKSGGILFTNVGTFTADISGLKDGAEIYVQSSRVFTKALPDADAANKALTYFKGAVRTDVSVTNTFALEGKVGAKGYCPHCSNQVDWTTTIGDGHCYLSGSIVRTGNLTLSGNVVLDLNGYTIHEEARRVIFNSDGVNGMSMTVMDSFGGGRIQGTGTGNANGGLLYIGVNSTFELLSGTLALRTPVTDGAETENIVQSGGVIHAMNNTNIQISGGVISNGAISADGSSGGNISMNGDTGKLTVSAGIIKDGTAAGLKGGNIYSNAPVEITGGVILNGSAKNGGNLYAAGQCQISGGLILSGNATDFGGNIYQSGECIVSNGMIAFGTATTGGGNIGVYGTRCEITDNAKIISGQSTARGGNIAVGSSAVLEMNGGIVAAGNASTRGGNMDLATETSTINIVGGRILLGSAPNGGSLYINNGKLNVTGGEIIGGTATKSGGNIYLNYYVYATIKDDGNTSTALPRISHGEASDGNGGNIYLTAADTSTKYYLHLGNSIIRDGNASKNGQNIYLSEKGVFKVLKEFSQNTTAFLHESRNPVKGGLLTEGYNTAEGTFTGELRLENIDSSPMVCAEDGKLRVTAAAVVFKDGTSLWFGNNADAVKNYSNDAAWLIADAGDLVLNGSNYTVDLAGQDLNITGTGSITCFDSANNDYSRFGTAVINGPTLKSQLQNEHEKITYIHLLDGEKHSFHRLDMKVESISIRPESAGMYYSCYWNCDEALAANLEYFGVALSLADMPDANLFTDRDTLYTRQEQNAFTPGQAANSVLVSNILKTGNQQNDNRGKMNIYATPYITIKDHNGATQTVVAMAENQIGSSLHDTMKLMDQKIASDPTNYRRLTLPLRQLHNAWKEDGMQTWEFTKIPEPEKDDVIDVLMIGSSFCYYYVEELYGLAEAAGVKMRVCNVYYSGCRYEWHYTWWKQGKSNYEFYQVTDSSGRKKTNGTSLEYCLAQGDWDVISIQESTSLIYNVGAQKHLNATRAMRNELIGYLQEQFPNAKTYWHQPWSYQIGYKSGNKEVNTFEQQQERMMAIREFALGVCAENGTGRVNTGEAWQLFRKNYVQTGDSGLTDTLCARLGVGTNDVGDYYHDGDIGGGQYLNACVWFETIMNDLDPGKNYTCVGNTFRPNYKGKTLSETLIAALQESAHQAFIERDWDTPSTETAQ